MIYIISIIFSIVILGILPGTLIYLLYKIPTQKGNKKLGNTLAIIGFITTLIIAFWLANHDMFFTKREAKNRLKSYEFELKNDFQILDNHSGGINDYVYFFSLEISNNDKKRFIQFIKSSPDFFFDRRNQSDLQFNKNKAFQQFWETQHSWNYCKYETFPEGAPILTNISVSKKNNTLNFEYVIK